MRRDLDDYGKYPASNSLNLNLSQRNDMLDTCLSFKNIRQSQFNNNTTAGYAKVKPLGKEHDRD